MVTAGVFLAKAALKAERDTRVGLGLCTGGMLLSAWAGKYNGVEITTSGAEVMGYKLVFMILYRGLCW